MNIGKVSCHFDNEKVPCVAIDGFLVEDLPSMLVSYTRLSDDVKRPEKKRMADRSKIILINNALQENL